MHFFKAGQDLSFQIRVVIYISGSGPGVDGWVAHPRQEASQPSHHVDDRGGDRGVRVWHVHVQHAVQVGVEQRPVVPDREKN